MGSSGGGGSSGDVDYPEYLKEVQSDWLNEGDASPGGGVDTIDASITAVMNTAFGNDPWAAASAYNPTTRVDFYRGIVAAFGSALAGVTPMSEWTNAYVSLKSNMGDPYAAEVDDAADITDAEILLDVAAHAAQLDDEILTTVLPRFRRGMQDVNAVVSSAFPIGQANIEGFRDRDVAKHSSALRVQAALKNADIDVANLKKDSQLAEMNLRSDLEYQRLYVTGTDQIVKSILQMISFEESYVRSVVESERIGIVAMKEYTDATNVINEESATWDLEVFQYGANLLASVSGGTMGTKAGKKPPLAVSVLGGAMSGAASGAMIGGAMTGPYAPAGAAIGAILGAAMGLMSGS